MINPQHLNNKLAARGRKLNTAAPDELTGSRRETPEEGLEKSAFHAQPAQARETSAKERAGEQSKTNSDLHILTLAS